MKSIIGFELKKILQKKIVWITFIIFFIFQLMLTSFAYLFSSRYIDGKFLETKADWFKTDRKNAEELSGKKIDDNLLSRLEESNKYIPDSEDEAESYEYLSSDDYQKKARPYEPLRKLVKTMLYAGTGNAYTSITSKVLYSTRLAGVEERWDAHKLTEDEKEYWRDKESQLPDTFTYKYGGAYERLVDMSGCYYICMFITFFIAICITSIFTEEHLRKTDQLVLCTKYGRKQSYIAKIIAGCTITICMTLIFWISTFICFVAIYGIGNFSAMVQVTFDPIYSGTLTIGQAALVMTGLLLLSSIVLCIITMVLSELINSNVGVMAIVIAVFFLLARLVYVPADFKFIAKVWNILPINLLKGDQGLFDVRLWNIFGIKLTLWQMAIIIYIITGLVFFFIGKKKYCKYQVSAR